MASRARLLTLFLAVITLCAAAFARQISESSHRVAKRQADIPAFYDDDGNYPDDAMPLDKRHSGYGNSYRSWLGKRHSGYGNKYSSWLKRHSGYGNKYSSWLSGKRHSGASPRPCKMLCKMSNCILRGLGLPAGYGNKYGSWLGKRHSGFSNKYSSWLSG